MKRAILDSALSALVLLLSVLFAMFFAASAPVWVCLATGSWWWMLLYVFYAVAIWAYYEYDKEWKHGEGND